MNQRELVAWLAQCLTTTGIPFMVVGSLCSSYHSEPRFTHDADLVIDPSATQLDQFLALLGPDVYCSTEAAHEALQKRHQFNIIDFAGGWKADLIIRKQRAFATEELQRRLTVNWHGLPMPMATAEDVMLAKLDWNQITPSEQQLKDVLKVAVAQWPSLDQAYLRKWAQTLGVSVQLDAILRQAEAVQA